MQHGVYWLLTVVKKAMRKSFLTFILFNMCLCCSMAQDSTRANLYPLEDGDYWEYDSHEQFAFEGIVFTASRRVIGDTLMPNGKTYKQIRVTDLDGNANGTVLVRIDDSLNVLEHTWHKDIELLRFKLSAQVGEKWFPFFPDTGLVSEVVDIYDVFTFGKTRRVMQVSSFMAPFEYAIDEYTLLEGIGMDFWAVADGFYWSMRGAVINGIQYGVTAVKEKEEIIPATFKLFQNYPNPFNSETNIRYKIPGPGAVEIVIYDMAGREVIQLVDRPAVLPGEYAVTWNGRNSEGIDSSSGVYWVQFRSGTFINTKKMILLR